MKVKRTADNLLPILRFVEGVGKDKQNPMTARFSMSGHCSAHIIMRNENANEVVSEHCINWMPTTDEVNALIALLCAEHNANSYYLVQPADFLKDGTLKAEGGVA